MRAIIDEIEGQVEPDQPPGQDQDERFDSSDPAPEDERLRAQLRKLEHRCSRLRAD